MSVWESHWQKKQTAMKLALALVFVTLTTIAAFDPSDFQADSDEALQFLQHDRRTLFHPGKTKCEEQKREARKGYEEKCSFLGKRFCPKLSTWTAFQQYEIGDGYKKNRPLTTTESSQIRQHTMRTYSTSLYGPSTPRPVYRTPIYRPPATSTNRVTYNPFD